MYSFNFDQNIWIYDQLKRLNSSAKNQASTNSEAQNMSFYGHTSRTWQAAYPLHDVSLENKIITYCLRFYQAFKQHRLQYSYAQ